jgi:transcription elongation regulator 1
VIPGTGWTRVTTNEGNVFYFEKESKRSEWSVPEEIREEVAVLQAEEEVRRVEAEREEKERAEVERMERLKERERLREEVEEERKRKAVERERKRKEREEDGEEEEEPDAKVSKTDGEGDGEFGPQNEEDEEAWMKAVAAEFADADKALKAEQKRDKENLEREEEEAAKKVFAVPEKVNVTLEEGRALFKVRKDPAFFGPR